MEMTPWYDVMVMYQGGGEVILELIICHFKNVVDLTELVLSWMETKFGVQTLHGKYFTH